MQPRGGHRHTVFAPIRCELRTTNEPRTSSVRNSCSRLSGLTVTPTGFGLDLRPMALKPPPIGEFVNQVSSLLGNSGLKGEVDKSVRTLVQAALSRMDLVSREEFDTQAEILARTRGRVEELERELEKLVGELEASDPA